MCCGQHCLVESPRGRRSGGAGHCSAGVCLSRSLMLSGFLFCKMVLTTPFCFVKWSVPHRVSQGVHTALRTRLGHYNTNERANHSQTLEFQMRRVIISNDFAYSQSVTKENQVILWILLVSVGEVIGASQVTIFPFFLPLTFNVQISYFMATTSASLWVSNLWAYT